jgi:hypothetical protein
VILLNEMSSWENLGPQPPDAHGHLAPRALRRRHIPTQLLACSDLPRAHEVVD